MQAVSGHACAGCGCVLSLLHDKPLNDYIVSSFIVGHFTDCLIIEGNKHY